MAFAIALAILMVATRSAHAAPVTDDRYLAGYATAVLERELRITAPSLAVANGVVTIRASDLRGADPAAVQRTLASIPGVAGVRIVDGDTAVADAGATDVEVPPTRAARREAALREGGFLPRGQLFRPLLADPRWPRFSAVYRYYLDDDELGSVGAANFGATLPLYRDTAPFPGDAYWETGLQAGVFSIFDLEADSKDLINSDFFVALFASHRAGDFSVLGRFLHQSSHLGDEFLLRNRTERINLSYEAIDVKLSYDLLDVARLYGGGGYLFDQEPSDLDPAVVQYGLEATSPWSLGGTATPVAAIDIQHTEESHWTTQFSVLAGLQLERLRVADTALLVAAEWFRGQSPNGQFYRRKVEWLGIGAHFYF